MLRGIATGIEIYRDSRILQLLQRHSVVHVYHTHNDVSYYVMQHKAGMSVAVLSYLIYTNSRQYKKIASRCPRVPINSTSKHTRCCRGLMLYVKAGRSIAKYIRLPAIRGAKLSVVGAFE